MKKDKINSKKLPDFKKMSDAQIAEFWETHEVTEFTDDLMQVTETFVDVRPKKTISMRIDEKAINELRELASKKGIGYQTLMRMWIKERLAEEQAKVA